MGKNYNSSRLVNGLSVDASGNVGIATSSPVYKLDVTGTGRTTTGTYLATSSGNVGIGTTSPYAIATGRNVTIEDSTNNDIALSFGLAGTRTAQIYTSGLQFRLSSVTNIPMLFFTNDTEKMRITAAGNVGIGTSSPSYLLDIMGSSTDIDGFFRVQGYSGGAGNAYVLLKATGGGNAYINSTGTGSLRLGANGAASNALTILSNGNVLINATSDPSVKLQVVQSNAGDWTGDFKNYTSNAYGLRVDLSGSTGSSSNSAFQIYTQTGSGLRVVNNGSVTIGSVSNYSQYKLVITSTGTTNATAAFRCEDSATYGLFEVLSDGAIKMGGRTNSPYNYAVTGSIKAAYLDSNGGFGYNSSTRESKANITSMNSANWLNQLTPVTFNKRKKDDDGNYIDEFYDELHYGFIADEMEAINQDFVFYDEMDGNKKLAGIHYDRLIAPLVKAIQEQQAQIQELNTKLQDQQQTINSLINR